MNQKEKKVIFTLIGVMVVILLIVVIVKGENKKKYNVNLENTNTEVEQNVEKYVTNLSDETKLNSSDEFNKTKTYKQLEISNVQFTYQDGKSQLLANVKNTASSKHESEIIKLTILDENNNIIDELAPVIPSIEAGETKQINVIISGANSVNAKDFKIEAK